MLLLSHASLLAFLVPTLVAGQSVQEVLSTQPELSQFRGLTTRFPNLLSTIGTNGGTLLAPSNAALTRYFNEVGVSDPATLSEADLRALLSYHSVPLALRSTDLSRTGGALLRTALTDPLLANLEGVPNVVFASAFGSTGEEVTPSGLRVYSGIGTPANVTIPDVRFDAGYIHIIDSVLNLPRNCTKTAEIANLSNLLKALVTANLTQVVDTTPRFTCFAPSDAAFQAAGIDVEKLSTNELVDALKYHSIVGDVGYSTAFEDGKEYQTLLGVPVTVHKRGGKMFINDVEVLRGNVIMNNGVAHVLNGVLTPPQAPGGGATVTGPTTTITSVPSGVPVPTNAALRFSDGSVGSLFASVIFAMASVAFL